MISENLNNKIKCDMGGCSNLAVRSFRKNDNRRLQINLCEQCMREMYEVIGKTIVPKSPDNIINKKLKQRKENE